MTLMLFLSERKQRKRYEQFISPHVNHLYGLACRFSQSREDAEDITQDLLIKLFKQQKLLEMENPRAYLSRALYNQYVDYMRKQGRHLGSVDIDIDNEVPAPEAAASSPESAAEFDLNVSSLDSALGKLSSDHRDIVILHDIEGFTYDEISDLLKIAPGTAKSRHHRARTTLKAALTRQ